MAACGGGDAAGPDAGPADAGYQPGPIEPFPEAWCPGRPGCTGEGGGGLRVGAARASIMPELVETEWTDENGNGHYDSGEPFVDANGNGEFDPYWIAGFGTGRPAVGLNDGVWASAIAFEWRDVRVAIVVLDVVGWFITDHEPMLDLLPASLELDHVMMASTHDHEAIDTVGKWGRNELESGVDPDYIDFVRRQAAAAIEQAVAHLEPVTMEVAQTRTVDADGSSLRYVGDRRDPVILDPTLTVIRFAAAGEPERTVASIVHWAAHPEYGGSRNNLVSSDYPHWLRDTVENGAPATATEPAIDGIGGIAIFLNGPIGGQIGDNGVVPLDADGTPITSDGLHKSERIGVTVGRLALEAITSADRVVDVPDPQLHFRTGRMVLVVENVFFHVAGLIGLFNRPFFGYDETKPIDEGNFPYLESRVTYLQVGNVGLQTVPGELDPSIAIGGFDGSQAWGDDFIDPDNEFPPDLSKAPPPPYLRDLILANPGVEVPLVVGMGEDYLGYIVPAWNYILHPDNPYIEEFNGSQHYEETLSLGPDIEQQAVGPARLLLQWRPPAASR
ncbi:MAG: hypothetical protein D6689_12150 [Deltaproteobacteria bacterium]|nr:MAG: hypothetical protein D6689_12150 [Deltaproteobacteria bacterium]